MTATAYRPTHEPTSRELELLLELTRHLAAVDNIEAVLETVANEFRPLVPFERIEFSTPEQPGVMAVQWVWTNGTPPVVAPGEMVPHKYPTTGPMTPQLIGDLVSYAIESPDAHVVKRLVDAGYRSSIACPLVVADQLEGVVFFNTAEANTWNLRHRTLVELVAGHLAIAASRVRLTAALKASNQHLTELHAARTRFLAAVSHEIRSPLTGVLGITRVLAESADRMSASEIMELAGMLDQQARDVTDLADDLLVASRFDAGGMRVEALPVDLGEAVVQAVESVGGGFSPEINGVSGRALADPLRLRQILRNLLTNAVRHGGPTVVIEHRSVETGFEIEVRDDGDGISEEFDPFAPFETAAAPHVESVGLGLAVSRSLAEAMGGSLHYTRREGWTVLTVSLPGV